MHSRLFSIMVFFLSLSIFTAASHVPDVETRALNARAVRVVSAIADLVGEVNDTLDVIRASPGFPPAQSCSHAYGPAAVVDADVHILALSTADKNAVKQNAATAINNSVEQVAKVPQTPAVVARA